MCGPLAEGFHGADAVGRRRSRAVLGVHVPAELIRAVLGESEPGALGATHRTAIPAVEGKALAHGGDPLSPRHFFQ